VLGAYLNVKINASDLKDRIIAAKLLAEAEKIAQQADILEKKVLEIVNKKIG